MDVEIILAILGVFATVIFGGLSIYLFIKQYYPGQITFVVEDCFALFESIVKQFPELSVLYKDIPVGEGVILLKGAMLNTGNKDITKEMIEEKLRLELPEHFKWLHTKVVSDSSNVHASIEQHGTNALAFDIGLFRCHEFVRFECLAEVPILDNEKVSIESRFLNKLEVHHRIADTQKVIHFHLPYRKFFIQQSKRFYIPFFAAFMALSVFALTVLLLKDIPPKVHFHMATATGQRLEVSTLPQGDGTIFVRGVEDRTFKKYIPIVDFFSIPDLQPKTVPNKIAKVEFWSLVFFHSLMLLFSFSICLFILLKYRRMQYIRTILGLLN